MNFVNPAPPSEWKEVRLREKPHTLMFSCPRCGSIHLVPVEHDCQPVRFKGGMPWFPERPHEEPK